MEYTHSGWDSFKKPTDPRVGMPFCYHVHQIGKAKNEKVLISPINSQCYYQILPSYLNQFLVIELSAVLPIKQVV